MTRKCILSRSLSALIGILSLLAAGEHDAHAGPVLDQSMVPPDPPTDFSGFGSVAFNQQRAQTFTVGITGVLTQVSVDLERFGTGAGNLVMEIRQTTLQGGVYFPVSNGFLLQTSVPATSVPAAPIVNAFTTFDLSVVGLQVNAGDHLAIVLYAQGGSGYEFNWEGAINNPYPAGEAFERVIGNHEWVNESSFAQNYDLGFQTFVDSGPAAAPEPSSLLLASVSALGMLGFGWRRRRRTS
jgi:hypothetical protein